MASRRRFDRDYYATLGVPATAGDDEIRRAYRQLALRWHPDRNAGSAEAAERFKEISVAYAVLIDPVKRRDYDRARQVGAHTGYGGNREDLFRDLFADPRASAIFEELAREMQRMGLRVERNDFQQTLFGGRTVVRGTVIVVSPFTPLLALFRLGRAAMRAARGEAPAEALPRRRGVVDRLAAAGRWLFGLPAADALAPGAADVVVPLPLTAAEARTGAKKRVTLPDDGRNDDVIVTIPAGVRAGTRLRLRGKGRTANGRRGDAYLAIEVVEDR